jgi:hypothetical protein
MDAPPGTRWGTAACILQAEQDQKFLCGIIYPTASMITLMVNQLVRKFSVFVVTTQHWTPSAPPLHVLLL